MESISCFVVCNCLLNKHKDVDVNTSISFSKQTEEIAMLALGKNASEWNLFSSEMPFSFLSPSDPFYDGSVWGSVPGSSHLHASTSLPVIAILPIPASLPVLQGSTEVLNKHL